MTGVPTITAHVVAFDAKAFNCTELLKSGLRSRRFLGGVGFLTTLRIGVGFFCPTPDVQLDHFYITLPNLEFLLKWYSSF